MVVCGKPRAGQAVGRRRLSEDSHDAHSIYFEVLAEHGFVGLALFLSIGVLALLNTGRLAKLAPQDLRFGWIPSLAAMIQISLVSYATTGAFLGLAYFDLYYQLLAIVVVINLLASQKASPQPLIRAGPGSANTS